MTNQGLFSASSFSPKIILASSSPRRQELLTCAGICFEIMHPVIDESPKPGESIEELVMRLAYEKAAAVQMPNALVLGADTLVLAPNNTLIFSKPEDLSDAARMLGILSGQTHTVMTGTCVLNNHTARQRITRTAVTFRHLSPHTIDWYLNQNESMDKAGSYSAQGKGMSLIARIEGSYTNVIGLPLAEVLDDLS